MKRLSVFTVLVFLSIYSFATHKYGFKNGEIFYNITDKANLTVEVTYGSNYGEYFGNVEIPSKTSYNGVYYTVTSVGDHAFSGCSGLTKVTFPKTVTKIGDYAFSGCNAMLTMTIPATIMSIGNYAFNSCSSLSSIEFEFSQTNLSLGHGCSKGGNYSLFYDCPLESVTLTRVLSYSTSSSYGYSPFAYHPTLKSAIIKNWIGTGDHTFYGCASLTSVTLPDFLVRIGDYSFAGCKRLMEIEIPANVTAFGNSAFRNCRFTSFTIGSGVESIGEYCFADCISLKSFTIPSNVTSIGNYAFSGCTAIETLKFEHGSNKKLSIGHGASKGASYSLFYDCPLESVTLGRGTSYNTSSSYGYSPFANHPTLKSFTFEHIVNTGSYMLYGCPLLTSVTLGSMVTIDDYAFANCKSLSAIDIPATITTIGNSAFRNCNWFTSFTIGKGVETIGEYCFAGCVSMDDFTIPGNVTKIGNYAFSNCTRIKKVSIEKGSTALSLGFGASKGAAYGLFYDCPLESVSICRGLGYNTSKDHGYSPFAYNNTLTTATFGSGATRIGNYLFCGDVALNSVTMTDEMTAIANYALYGCVGIKSFVIGRNVETIGEYAFSNCTNLTGLIFPPSVTSIGNYAFRNCTSFNNFAIEESTEKLQLGNGSSEGEKTALFRDCPITSVFIGRNLSYNYAPLYNITTLTEARFGNPVTRIPNYILQGCTELNTVYFNKSCEATAIGKYAFGDCKKLASLNLPEGITSIDEGAFQRCTGFRSFIIGDKVETIGDYAFDGCNQLTGLIFPPSLKSIGNYAFRGCTAMNNITFEEGTESLDFGAGASSGEKDALFSDCPIKSVFIGRNFTYSTASPLKNNSALTSVRIGNPVTRIPNYVFQGDTELTKIVFNQNCELKSVGKYAFDGCSKLSAPDFPQTVTMFEEGAFRGCIDLTTFTIRPTITEIGNYVFNNCSGLTELIIEDADENLQLGYGSNSGDTNKAGKGLFSDCPLNSVYIGRTLSYYSDFKLGSSPFARVASIKQLRFGDKVASIGAQYLRGCSGIESLAIPDNVTKIGKSAFIDCSGLKSITLSSGLNTIGDFVFYGCSSLTEIRIPASVTSIGNYAFQNCSNLTDLVIDDSDTELTMGYGASQGEAYGLFRDTPLESLYMGRTLSYTEKKDNGYSPFAYVGSLSKVTIGTKVKSLNYCIFYSTAISELYIPSSVRTIHSSAFNNCKNLKKVIILGSTPPTADTHNTMLSNSAEDSKFYVFFPEKYKSTKVWSTYANKIEACCELYGNFTYSGDGHVIGYKTDFPIVLDNRDTEAVEVGTYQKPIEVTYQTNSYSMKDVLKYEYTIKKAPLTITSKSYSRSYGEENPEFKYDFEGFVNGEDEHVLTKEPIATTKATTKSSIGEYDILLSGAEAKNYDFKYNSGTLTITQAPLTIIAQSYTRKQGEKNPTFALSYKGFVNGEKETVLTKKPTITCEATEASEPSEYDIVVSGAESKNYDITYQKGTLTVTEADLVTVTAKSYTRVYGKANPTLEYTAEGEELKGSPILSCAATTASPVGEYPITVKKGTVTNYNTKFVDGVLTITKAPLTITAKSYSRKQGEQNPVFTVSYDGFANGEKETVLTTLPVISCEATESSEPGEYDIVVSRADAANYAISYVAGKLTVTEADAVKVTAKSYTRIYGAENPEFAYEVEGAALDGQPEISCEATATSPVGPYPIIIKKGSVKNYNDSYVDGVLTITKAPLTVTAQSYTRKQGEPNPEFAVGFDGFVNGETEAVLTVLPSISCEATESSEPGEYDIVVSGADAANYDISYVAGKLTVLEPDKISDADNQTPRIVRIFSVGGKPRKELQKGVNIVLMSNGTTSKVVVK